MFIIAAAIILAGVVLAFMASGVVIAIAYSPRSPIAWILLLTGLVGAAAIFALANGSSLAVT